MLGGMEGRRVTGVTLEPMRLARMLGGMASEQEGVVVVNWGSVRLNTNYSLWLGQSAVEVQASAAGVPALQYLLVGPYRLETSTAAGAGRRVSLGLVDAPGQEVALAAELPPTFLWRRSPASPGRAGLSVADLQEAAVLLDGTLQSHQGALQLQWGGERNSIRYRLMIAGTGTELQLAAAWRGQTVARVVLEQAVRCRSIRGGMEFVAAHPQQEVILRVGRGGPAEVRASARR